MAVTEAGRRELFSKYMTEEYGVTVNEIMGGLALIALGILALAKVDPMILDSIAVIVAGVALMIVSAGLGVELSRAVAQSSGRPLNSDIADTGLNAGVMGGVAGLVLGILALLNVRPGDLVAIAIIIYGGAVLFDFLATVQIRTLAATAMPGLESGPRMTSSGAVGSSTIAMIAGTGLITLGILALVGIVRVDLVAIGLLGLGAFLFLAASSVAGRMLFQAP